MDVGTNLVESLEGLNGSIQHLEDFPGLIHHFADSAVTNAEGSVVHGFYNRFPSSKVGNQLNGISRAFASEIHGVTVCIDEITLGGLVESELRDLRQVLGGPAIDNSVDGLLVDAAL